MQSPNRNREDSDSQLHSEQTRNAARKVQVGRRKKFTSVKCRTLFGSEGKCVLAGFRHEGNAETVDK